MGSQSFLSTSRRLDIQTSCRSALHWDASVPEGKFTRTVRTSRETDPSSYKGNLPYSEGNRPYRKGRAAVLRGKRRRGSREESPYSEGNPTVPEGKFVRPFPNEFRINPLPFTADLLPLNISQYMYTCIPVCTRLFQTTSCWCRLTDESYILLLLTCSTDHFCRKCSREARECWP
jgi:hypothetical protein